MTNHLLSRIPKVDSVLERPSVGVLVARYTRGEVVAALRRLLETWRAGLKSGAVTALPDIDADDIIEALEADILQYRRCNLRRVINATGVILHTNLGRAPLSPAAIDAVATAARGYSNLEFDLEVGDRGSRHDHVASLLCELTGAEAALVVNNCAAAVLVTLSALAGPSAGRSPCDVVVSRGELIEIGGAFRMPDVIVASGARLVEVGTTNKTHLSDYASAMRESTGVLLTTHPSNYRVVGFTAKPALSELVALARSHDLPLVEDLGSGLLVDAEGIMGIREPNVQHSIQAGVDIVTFSGDKLLGGPQAGIIAGKKHWIASIRKHPLMRAVRIDKLSLAALEATLRAYGPERNAMSEVPVLRMLSADAGYLQQRAREFADRLHGIAHLSVRLRPGVGYTGGGTLPMHELPATLLALDCQGMSADALQVALRRAATPVIGRIVEGAFVIDLRTVLDEDLDDLFDALVSLQAEPD